VAVATALGLGAGPAVAEEDAAFIPAGQDAAWFSAARFKLTDALTVGTGDAADDRASAPGAKSGPFGVRLVARLSPAASLGFAFEDGLDRLVADLRDKRRRPTFLVAGDPLVDIGFQRREQTALALRGDLAGWGVTASAEGGEVAAAAFGGEAVALGRRRPARPASATRYGLAVDREFGTVLAAFGGSWLTENQTILGARVREGYNTAGADSLFLDAELSWRPAFDWRVGAAWRHGSTEVASISGVTGGLRLTASAWAVDVSRFGVFGPDGALSLRVSQPLRVANGAGKDLPVEYGYDFRGSGMVATGTTLAPSGREIAAELNWQGPVLRGWATAGLYYRRDPGHLAALPDDHGAALSWSARF
jgi:hypothetical protein